MPNHLCAIDEVVAASLDHAKDFPHGDLDSYPSKKLAILVCMDTRIVTLDILGLKAGEAHIIRNAGGLATDDAIRSLIISHHLLGANEFMVINHTLCGMLNFDEEKLLKSVEDTAHPCPVTQMPFLGFDDLEENVRVQVRKIKSHPWLPHGIPVRGFIYNVETGQLAEVTTK